MESEREFDVSDTALILLDIIVIMLTDENPVLGVSLLVLLKTVSDDPMVEVLFILLAIVLWVWRESEAE